MDFKPFLEASTAIQIHAIAAIAAFVLGLLVLWRRKGDRIHRLNGRVWVVLMVTTALSGFFIHEIRMWGLFSPIHLFSVVVPISLAHAIYAARQGRISEHKRTMQATYVGGMVVAGGFTFFPGRLNYQILFGDAPVSTTLGQFGWLLPFIGFLLIAAWFARPKPTV